MKIASLYISLVLTLGSLVAQGQNYDFKIMAWNIQWLGDPNFCNCDTALQRSNVETILQIEKPDFVAIQEVVDIDKLQHIADALDYNVIIAPYASLAPDTNSGNYAGGQKLAFLYRKSNIKLLQSYGLMRSTYPLYSNNNSPYYYCASGRFPYLATFEIYDGADRDTITLVNIHAKASSTNSDYQRRKSAARVMQDSLDKAYVGQKVLVLGDYNDLLEGSIVSAQNYTPYAYNISQGYMPLTLPSDFVGQTTYLYRNNSIIDNFMATPEFTSQLKNSSVEILSRVSNYITSYASTTSDHYPIMLKYTSTVPNLLSGTVPEYADRLQVRLADHRFYIEHDLRDKVTAVLSDVQGKILARYELSYGTSSIELAGVSGQPIVLSLTSGGQVIHRQLFIDL